MYMQRATSGAADNGLHITIKYMRGAAGIGLGITIKYLQRAASAAANSGLSTTIKYLVNQNAGAVNNWAKGHIHESRARFLLTPPCIVAAFVVNLEPHTGARNSASLCVGPELARCVHI
jgi:hypothetical protein